MTVFDLIAFAVVVWSALAGSRRGAVTELLSLVSVALSAMATIAALPATAAIARGFLHAGWLSAVVAAVVTFAVAFVFLRLLAASLTRAVNQSLLSGANRLGGLVFGAVRGVVIVALFALVFDKATPQALKPGWITNAATYPLASDAGAALQTFLPKRFDLTAGFGDRLTRSIHEESSAPAHETPSAPEEEEEEEAPAKTPSADPSPTSRHDPASSERAKPHHNGYTQHARDSVDALVERSH